MSTAPLVLLVEDEEELVDAARFLLEEAGFGVLVANGGSEAFEIVKTRNPDIVVTDIKMPNGDGLELLKKIRKFNPKIPVVIVSAWTREMLGPGKAEGAVAFHSKPINFEDLIKTLQGLSAARQGS